MTKENILESTGWEYHSNPDLIKEKICQAMDQYYNQAIDDATKALHDWWNSDSISKRELAQQFEALKKKP